MNDLMRRDLPSPVPCSTEAEIPHSKPASSATSRMPSLLGMLFCIFLTAERAGVSPRS
jgi:hypothetical protein